MSSPQVEKGANGEPKVHVGTSNTGGNKNSARPRPPKRQRMPYYNPYNYTMTPALLRAREPYFKRNLLVAGGLLTFITSVYFYSLNAFKVDDFSDVPLPPISDQDLAKLKSEQQAQQKS